MGYNRIDIYGQDHASSAHSIRTSNAAKSSSIERLNIPGGADTAVVTWASVIHDLLNSRIIRCDQLTGLTIATGAVTRTRSYHTISAQTGTTDDLDTINSGTQGDLLVIQAYAGHTITVRHEIDNISLNGGANVNVSGKQKMALIYDGTYWGNL